MSRGRHDANRAKICARVWRSFVTAAYLFGILAWTAGDPRPPTISVETCFYGRCPTMDVATGGASIHPTLANVALFGIAAALVAWAVPFVVQTVSKRGD